MGRLEAIDALYQPADLVADASADVQADRRGAAAVESQLEVLGPLSSEAQGQAEVAQAAVVARAFAGRRAADVERRREQSPGGSGRRRLGLRALHASPDQ
ncbi:hypothetical protein [Engelhardtia mirabilis]|uniref:hypothetical protein n=1 Tax=Engelhardtia mirabilis TaxID=2528011 RepID=UPI003AF3967F